MTLTTNELIVIREALHSITIKGVDAPIVGEVLDKVYKGIEKAALEQQKDEQKKKAIEAELAQMAEASEE